MTAALLSDSGRSISDITPLVYDDVPPFLHPIAQQSLHAHLLKLKEEGLVSEKLEKWMLLK